LTAEERYFDEKLHSSAFKIFIWKVTSVFMMGI